MGDGWEDLPVRPEEMPQRCPVAQESEELGQEARVPLHGKRSRAYRVYYSIHGETQTVRVFHVRHWARRGMSTDELDQLMDEFLDQEDET